MSPTQRRKALVLIVDDNPANLGVLVKLLTRQDLEVSIAEDSESALDQAEAEHAMAASSLETSHPR